MMPMASAIASDVRLHLVGSSGVFNSIGDSSSSAPRQSPSIMPNKKTAVKKTMAAISPVKKLAAKPSPIPSAKPENSSAKPVATPTIMLSVLR